MFFTYAQKVLIMALLVSTPGAGVLCVICNACKGNIFNCYGILILWIFCFIPLFATVHISFYNVFVIYCVSIWQASSRNALLALMMLLENCVYTYIFLNNILFIFAKIRYADCCESSKSVIFFNICLTLGALHIIEFLIL